MASRNWKRVAATSLPNAMELCIEYARDRHNRSVEGIAALMGVANKYTLYKWVESGKLPAISIRPFEHACGIDFVTRYLAHSTGKLLIEIPIGRCPGPEDVLRVQGSCHAAVDVLIKFYKGELTSEQASSAVTVAMEDLAWHRSNAAKLHAPELDLEQ